MPEIKTGKPLSNRVEAIDAFRGFTIFAMIFVIMVAGYGNLPLIFPQCGSVPVSTFKHAGEDGGPSDWARWEKENPGTNYYPGTVLSNSGHNTYSVKITQGNETTFKTFDNVPIWTPKPLKKGDEIVAQIKGTQTQFQFPGIGCTFTDWVAPFFVFIVGLCIPLSRMRHGKDWWKHVGYRTLGLILLGMIYISMIMKVSYWWGILQAIGIAYFMGAAMMLLPTWPRWAAFFVLCIVHGWLSWNVPWWTEIGDKTQGFWSILNPLGDPLRPLTIHCTPWGSTGYGIITIAGTFLGEAVATRDKYKILIQSLGMGIILCGIGYLLHLYLIPINKDVVSVSYGIFTSGIGAIAFLAFYWVIDVWQFKKGWVWFLAVFGSNALLAYFMQVIVRAFMQALGLYAGLTSQSGWAGMLRGVEWTMILWCVVLYCNRKNIYWRL